MKLKYNTIEWDLIKGMRNKIVHNYDGIDTTILWKTIISDIPMLQKQLEEILINENDLLND